jgi:hypothetical protein
MNVCINLVNLLVIMGNYVLSSMTEISENSKLMSLICCSLWGGCSIHYYCSYNLLFLQAAFRSELEHANLPCSFLWLGVEAKSAIIN